jgi:hypothetical protein
MTRNLVTIAAQQLETWIIGLVFNEYRTARPDYELRFKMDAIVNTTKHGMENIIKENI